MVEDTDALDYVTKLKEALEDLPNEKTVTIKEKRGSSSSTSFYDEVNPTLLR